MTGAAEAQFCAKNLQGPHRLIGKTPSGIDIIFGKSAIGKEEVRRRESGVGKNRI